MNPRAANSTALVTCRSIAPAYWSMMPASSGASVTALGNWDLMIASVLLQGQTFTSDPMMNPARTIKVSLFHLARSQRRNFENPRMPIAAPAMNTAMINRFCPTLIPCVSSWMTFIMK